MIKIAVTGASGFIGSEIVKELLKKNYSTISFIRRNRISINHKFNQNICVDDINDYPHWLRDLKGVKCLVHTAAKVHVMTKYPGDDLLSYNQTNTIATKNLLNKAIKAGVKKFIFLSSTKVNGEETKLGKPFCLDDKENPRDSYSISKYNAEKEIKEIAVSNNIDFIILRLPLVYGRNVKGNFYKLIQTVKLGFPLPFGSINQNLRSYLSIYNLTDLILKIINNKNIIKDIFLVSDDDDVSTTTLLKKLSLAMNKKIYLVPIPKYILIFILYMLNKNNYSSRLFGNLQVDISKTKQKLNWRPLYNLEQGLEKMFKKYS